jgi:nucleotide-binding universal stress UspA family protein
MKTPPTADASRASGPLDRTDALSDRNPASRNALKNILVPIDFSQRSKEALACAIPMARQFGANLTLIHIVLPYCPVDPYGANLPDYFKPDVFYHAKKQLDQLALETIPAGINAQAIVRQGHSWPGQDIIDAAREGEIDLIVLSTHGHTGLRHVVFGSTAEYVVRHAVCPVLTVRCPKEPEE